MDIGNATNATALVIWLHGLGDTPSGWADIAKSLSSSPTLKHAKVLPPPFPPSFPIVSIPIDHQPPLPPPSKWHLPCAPTQKVTCNGGAKCTRCPSSSSSLSLSPPPFTPLSLPPLSTIRSQHPQLDGPRGNSSPPQFARQRETS